MNGIEIGATITLLVGVAALVYYWQAVRPRQVARARLNDGLLEGDFGSPPMRVAPRRYRFLAWCLAGGAWVVLLFFVGLRVELAAAIALVLGLLLAQWEASRVVRRELLIQTQLADAIDLMIGAMRAGGSVMAALETATTEARAPLQALLEEVLGRIRYGDDPRTVVRALAERVPLETFQLFATALSVHWEVGGSLAPTLATVGRAVRDRVELSRRVGSLTAEVRVSLIVVLAMTYLIALIVWMNEPRRMQAFLATTAGAYLAGGAILLQGLGIAWASSMARMKF